MTGSVSGAQLRAFIERIERLEEEKRTIADDIKEVKAEAKGCGFDLPTINAILKLRKKDAAERDEAQAMLDLYMSALGMLPLFERDGVTVMELGREPAQAYPEAKGRGFLSGLTEEQKAAALAYDGEDSPVGELTDNQEQPDEDDRCDYCADRAPAGEYYRCPKCDAEWPAEDDGETDDVGAAASSTYSRQREVMDPVAVEAATEKQAAGASRPINSNSQASPPPADSAGEAPSSSPASPARHSDDIDLTIPDFLRRTEGGYPKREAVDA